MTTILIVEGNTPEIHAAGNVAATRFQREITRLQPVFETRVLKPYEAPVQGSDFRDTDAVIFTGAGVAWSVGGTEGAPQVAAMELALAAGKPIWGSCNGMQLAAHVLGGAVGESPNGQELPVARDMQITLAGQDHPMMAGRRPGFAVPCVHRDEVRRLPEGATLLAGNAHTPIQAFVHEAEGIDLWATQYHPELSLADIAGFVRAQGIFADHAVMAEDLDAAEHNPDAARRLQLDPHETRPEIRATELANWLRHVISGG